MLSKSHQVGYSCMLFYGLFIVLFAVCSSFCKMQPHFDLNIIMRLY